MSDALKTFKFESGGDLFVKITEDKPVKLRVLTTDPLVSYDQWGNLRFSFVVWNFTENKAQVLNKGASIAQPIQGLHMDEDYGADIQKLDIKVTATGSGKETKYTVNPLPKSEELTDEMIKQAKKIDLEKIIKDGKRMSALNEGEKLSLPQAVREEPEEESEETVIEDINEDEPVDLSDIPF